MPRDPDVYRDELQPLGFGLPVYEPNPPGHDRVRIGDIGFINENGSFERIFNIFHDKDDPINSRQFGAPEGFTKVEAEYREECVSHLPQTWITSKNIQNADLLTPNDTAPR